VAETKYGKYILKEPHAKMWPQVPIYVDGTLNEGISLDIAVDVRTKPGTDDHEAHKHTVDEYLFFLGGDPTNYMDFQAEVELYLGWGKAREKHIINTAAFIYIPAGLVHLPWNFKRVDKPIMVGHILLAPNFTEDNTRSAEPD
jgi:mannose-6-phosphate isomerase-like protein (cupin superfamily)